MPVATSFTSERRIAASPEAVWAVIADPAVQERLDARVRLVSESGPRGEVGSSYEMKVRGVRFRTVVVAAEPGVRLAHEVVRGTSLVGEQSGELVGEADGTLLRWTVVTHTARLLRRVARANARRELPRWLESVAREAEATRDG